MRYEYDKLGRLTREDNERLGKTWTYAYDAGGNITEKLEYAYTKNENPGTITKEDGIVNDPIRKDRLKTYYGKSFAYDDKGFPTTYKGVSLAWNYRRLTSYGATSYTYDADNVRRTKKANGKTTTYYYEGSRLLAEKQGNRCVQYLYDHNGLTGFSDGGSPYLYGKNALGDITEIYDLFGNKVASYAYDAWGNCTVYTASGALDENASSIGNTNPFRYRGYYYDAETKLYYLINRYYDPEVGRFISPDHIGYMLEQMEQLNGCNLYAYCLNNPVNMIDSTGRFPILIALILGAFMFSGMAVGAVVANDQGKTGMDAFATVMLGGAIGLAAGGLVIATAGAGAAVFGSAGLATPFLGVTAYQAFAIGALVYDTFAFVVAPLLGVTVDGIETMPEQDIMKTAKIEKSLDYNDKSKAKLLPNNNLKKINRFRIIEKTIKVVKL